MGSHTSPKGLGSPWRSAHREGLGLLPEMPFPGSSSGSKAVMCSGRHCVCLTVGFLKLGFCTAEAFIQHSHRARIYADIWESELELNWICAQTLPVAAVQHDKGKTSPNHFLLTAQCGDLGLKMNIWTKAWRAQTRQSSRGANSGCLGLNLWFPVPRAAPLLKVMGKTPSKKREEAWECKECGISSGYELKAGFKTK